MGPVFAGVGEQAPVLTRAESPSRAGSAFRRDSFGIAIPNNCGRLWNLAANRLKTVPGLALFNFFFPFLFWLLVRAMSTSALYTQLSNMLQLELTMGRCKPLVSNS